MRYIVVFLLGLGCGVFGPFGCVHRVLDTSNKAVEKADTAYRKAKEVKEKADKAVDDAKSAADKLRK